MPARGGTKTLHAKRGTLESRVVAHARSLAVLR
jgi:hypothetical protein